MHGKIQSDTEPLVTGKGNVMHQQPVGNGLHSSPLQGTVVDIYTGGTVYSVNGSEYAEID